MIDYLGVDFGTTNCLAAVVSSSRKLQLIPLEGNNPILPSAIYIYSKNLEYYGISDRQIEIRIENEIKNENSRIKFDRENILMNLDNFRKENSPKYFSYKKPIKENYNSVNRYLFELKIYEEELKKNRDKQEYFNNVLLKKEEERLTKLLQSARPIAHIERYVRAKVEMEASETRSKELRNHTIFTSLQDPSFETLFGSDAINKYSSDSLCGFFMRSPKAFLAVPLNAERQELFVQIITLILIKIKIKSEEHTGKIFNGIVLGRPVNYMGGAQGGNNEQAISIMKRAARNAGFVEIRFVMEPLAASLVIPSAMFDTDNPALVADIGGGTTDIAYLHVKSDSKTKINIVSVAGERVGGNDFDQQIAYKTIGPFIGLSTNLKNGTPVPNSIVNSALSTRDINLQSKFRLSGDEIYKLLDEVEKLEVKPIELLYKIYRDQLQHKLILTAEQIKIDLAKVNSVTKLVDYLDNNMLLQLNKTDAIKFCQAEIKKIQNNILEAINNSPTPEKPLRLFLTGGMSYSPLVTDSIKEVIPRGSNVQRIDAFQSIVAGLASIARQLSLSDSVLVEPDNVRGIPVLR